MSTAASDQLDVDVAIVGSGFAGALAALALARRGRRVALIERGRHPRFVIGESTTPLTNLLLEEFADKYDLPQVRLFSKWGPWQRHRPDVACGLKRGFTFVFHRAAERFHDTVDHERQLLVAASPHDEVADTHWYRPDFDWALVRLAQDANAIYLDETTIDRLSDGASAMALEGSRGGHPVRVTARFVIDATGPRGFLATRFGLSEPLRWLPPTQGLYTHFEGVGLWEDVAPPEAVPPYPPDAAALHHVFPGGWIWVLRFNNGITSAGAALTDSVGRTIGASDGTAAWHRLLDLLPSVRDQFRRARATLPFVHAPRLAFRSRSVVGSRWALLPSAAGVIDPLLSTGFPLTLLGLGRLLDLLETTAPDSAEREGALARYAALTQAELDVTEQLVAALYANMADPEMFIHLSLLYFAAASFTETVRRLGREEMAPGFLLHGHPSFGPELIALAAEGARGDLDKRADIFARIDRAIEPFDTAGLVDRSRRHWYPVLAADLIAAGPKLHASSDELRRLLARCGLALSHL
jgi:FADH2 O2-dependent halogenase